MKIRSLLFGFALIFTLCSIGMIQKGQALEPLVLGHGVGLFKVGPLIVEEKFDDLDHWVVQLEPRDSPPGASPGHVEARDGNQFWMATDPVTPDKGLFDADRYTGKFGSYDKMHGYYASTGGGRNTTTRMRRYPRELAGMPAPHLALTARDGQRDYLIKPDKVMTIQLVAYDDVIQYIVDGRLNYEIASGDQVQIERRDEKGERTMESASYDLERFPVYTEGYFGFRMVNTHHVYSSFRAYTLDPAG